MSEAQDTGEAAIKQACGAEQYERAATLIVQRYGGEVLSFLMAQLGNDDAGHEAFADMSETMWRYLPGFEWRCSMRTWLYKLARQAAIRQGKQRARARRNVGLSHPGGVSRAIAQVRTATLAFRRTEVKTRFQKLREQLSTEDREILILRVDRKLSWLELAEVMLAEEAEASPLDEATLKREAARLRKRYQVAKERLRKMAEDEGLLGPRA